uniref:Uncharacterized protein n=1 Tax=Nicotiana tabacum TaxID=4097 RepID=A0A1S3ZMM4_TOBAC|nr:PREDICTED: uncharacterized protein LOC107788460 [Nicotiana tabacum]
MLRFDFNKTAKVWQNFVQARLMFVEHNSKCTRVRVCVISFLMTGCPINVGELMLGEMTRTRFGGRIKSFFFGNILTQYMLSRGVPEYPGYDEVVEAPTTLLNITSMLESTSKLTQAARNERDKNFNRYLYKSLNVIMSRLGVSDEKRTRLRSDLSSSSKEMLGIEPSSHVHPSEDENTYKESDNEDADDDEVIGPMALVPLGDDDEPIAAAGWHPDEADSD